MAKLGKLGWSSTVSNLGAGPSGYRDGKCRKKYFNGAEPPGGKFPVRLTIRLLYLFGTDPLRPPRVFHPRALTYPFTVP